MSVQCKSNKSPSHKAAYIKCLCVAIFGILNATAGAQEAPITLVDPVGTTIAAEAITLNDIEFNRAGDNAKIEVSFDNGIPEVAMIEASGKMTLSFEDSQLADEQYVEIDVSQFGTVVQNIETFQQDSIARVEVRYDGKVRVVREEASNGYIFTVSPISEEQLAKNKQDAYQGAPISLDFQDVPVRQVLQIIAQVNNFNLVTTDTVTGNVTISLSAVPWDQALDMILKIRGLDKRLEGNILLIAPRDELTARETQELQDKQQVQSLSELKSANIAVNYATALGLAEILKTEAGGILSERGTVSVDERTNTLLIRDTQESIDEARAVIETLDIPVRQVLIESRMVTVRENANEQLGVRWGFTGTGSDLSLIHISEPTIPY